MPLKLEEIDPAADFEELIACEWASFEKPPQTFFRLFFPVLGTEPDAHAEALKEGTVRQLQWFQSERDSCWQKVTDTSSGKIVAGALWKIHRTNPYEHPDGHSQAYWYPEGGQRDFVNQALDLFAAPRAKMAQRPHLFLNIIFTHPDYRRKGAADLIMQWGTQKADEMGLEMWLDATVYALLLYTKHGFVYINKNRLRPETDQPDEDWERIERELLPMTLWQMWRPSGGKYEEGKTVRPWEQEQ